MSEAAGLSVVHEVVCAGGRHQGWAVMCPACHCAHVFDDRWTFNGDMQKPTFNGSMLVRGYSDNSAEIRRCHSYVRDGKVQFLDDCEHELKNQTVALEPF